MNRRNLESQLNPAGNATRASLPALFLAGLPHLLLATVIALPAAFSAPRPTWLGALSYIILVVSGLALILAWRQGWPLWSGSWAGYWLILPINWLGSILPWHPAMEYLFFLPVVFIGLFLFIWRPLYGVLASVAPILLYTRLFVFEFNIGGDWVWSGIWLLLALASARIVWRGTVRAGVLIIISFQLLTGLIFAFGRAYLPYSTPSGLPAGPRPAPELTTMVNDLAPLTLAATAIPLALLLLQPLRKLLDRSGHRGRRSMWLLLLGMTFTYGCMFIMRARPSPFDQDFRLLIAAVIAGLLLSLGAAVSLIRSVQSGTGGFSIGAILVPLLAAFAPLVIFTLPLPFPGAGRYSNSFQVQILLSYIGVLTWTVLTILILTVRRENRTGIETTMGTALGEV